MKHAFIAERISARQLNPGCILAIVYVRTCPSRLGMSNVTLRNVNLLRLGINLLRLGMYITAHARKTTGRFTACANTGQLLSGQTTTLEREQWCVHGGLGGEL